MTEKIHLNSKERLLFCLNTLQQISHGYMERFLDATKLTKKKCLPIIHNCKRRDFVEMTDAEMKEIRDVLFHDLCLIMRTFSKRSCFELHILRDKKTWVLQSGEQTLIDYLKSKKYECEIKLIFEDKLDEKKGVFATGTQISIPANRIHLPRSCRCCGKNNSLDQVVSKVMTETELLNMEFFLCGKCMKVHYCSKECQVKDWPEHKKVCNKKH